MGITGTNIRIVFISVAGREDLNDLLVERDFTGGINEGLASLIGIGGLLIEPPFADIAARNIQRYGLECAIILINNLLILVTLDLA